MVVAMMVLGQSLPGSVSTAGPSLVSLGQSVPSTLARAGRGSLDKVDHSSIQLILRQLLLITENPATEYQTLSVGFYPHRAADLFLELSNTFLLVNILKLVVLRVQGLHCDCPHS